MNEEERRQSVKDWLDGLIEAYNKLGEPFDPEGNQFYYECPRCIEVHVPDKAIHLTGLDVIVSYLKLPSSYVKVHHGKKTYDKTSFVYRGYTFFEYKEV